MPEGQSELYYLQSLRRKVSSVRMLINKDVSRHIVLSDLARYAGVNECTLKRGFRTLFKTSVYHYLLTRRMHLARQLIVSTNLLIKDIALQSGYESLSGFITSFRKYFGYTPGQLRKSSKISAVNRL